MNENTDELYIYLGNKDNIHFFAHSINNISYKDNISLLIYDILVDKYVIESYNDKIIIFEIIRCNKELNVIIIDHFKGKAILFDKLNLENYLKSILQTHEKINFVISYDYNTNEHNLYELDNNKVESNIDSVDIKNIKKYITYKNIDFLTK